MRTLTELNYDEFKAVVENNRTLTELAFDNAIEDIDLYVSDILDGIPKAAHYDIGYCGSWLDLNNCKYSEIVKWIEGIQRMYYFLPDNFPVDELLKKYARYAEMVEDADIGYIEPKEKDYNYCEENAAKILDDITTALVREFRACYDISSEDEIRMAYEMEIFDDYYLDESENVWQHRNDLMVS